MGPVGRIVGLAMAAAAVTVAVGMWLGGGEASPGILLIPLTISALLLWRGLRR